MGLLDFIKKQFIDILRWTEDTSANDQGTLAWRFPMADMEIQYGGSLTVRESQVAVFVNEGKVDDVFGPGMHKLTTQTLPVLTYLKNWDKLFESPFKSDVNFFMQYQTAQAIPKCAENAGQGGGVAGDAMGLGAGLAMGQVLGEQLHGGLAGAAPHSAAPNTADSADAIMALLEKLGDLQAKGVLTEDEFAAKKAELLKKLG